MPAAAPIASFAMIRGSDQWLRASYDDAALLDGVVQLAWSAPAASDVVGVAPREGAGLALDAQCRLYHSVTDAGMVERILWSAEDPLRPGASPAPLELFEREPVPVAGEFTLAEDSGGPLAQPRGLAVDAEDRLFIAEAGARRVLVVDLWSRRVLRRIAVPGRPVDLVCDGHWVYAALQSPAGLVRFSARGLPQVRALPPGIVEPSRLALSPERKLYLLERAGTLQARIFDIARGSAVLDAARVANATDIEFHRPRTDAGPLLVVACEPGQDFLRFRLEAGGVSEAAPLTARGYDGLGIVRTPDERIACWTEKGLRYAVAARLRYAGSGSVTAFRLDSEEYQTPWGRLLIDACIPRDTRVRVRCIAADEPPDIGLIAREPPANVTLLAIPHDDQSPPMPAAWMVQAAPAALPLHRRAEGPELPWLRRAADDSFETYEAPVHAGPGRYLWVILELAGNTRSTPRIRALRAEFPGHDWLRRIPRTLSSEPQAGAFLQRYLAMLAGALTELDRRAVLRQVLLDAEAAPVEVLPWLASFLGLTLDERWSEAARRRAIREAVSLFRFRGTVPGLSRFIEIVLGVRPIIIEKFRLRGGGVVGEPVARSSRSILGGGLRVGGSVGTPGGTALSAETEDAFETHAHRFTVMLPALLSEDQIDMVADLLDVHRPAHTLYDLCTVGAGMRVGRGLHIGLTSLVGGGSGWTTLQLGAGVLGRGGIVGRPQTGTRVGVSRLPGGRGDAVLRGDTRVG